MDKASMGNQDKAVASTSSPTAAAGVAQLAQVLERLLATTSSRPSAASPAQSLWTTLSPAQRAILRFVARFENTTLTYASIAAGLELPTLSARRSVPSARPISDKTVRKHCERLFTEHLLVRSGERGPIQLSEEGHAVVAAHRRDLHESAAFD